MSDEITPAGATAPAPEEKISVASAAATPLGIDPVTNLNTVLTTQIKLYDLQNPVPAELDCFGKYANENDPACVGEAGQPNSACICFAECRARTIVRNEQLQKAARGEAPRKSGLSITLEELRAAINPIPEGFEVVDNPDEKVAVILRRGGKDEVFITARKKNLEIWGLKPIPGGRQEEDWYMKVFYTTDEIMPLVNTQV